MPADPTWIVTTAEGHAADGVARALAAAGFEVGEVLGAIGVITGRGSKALAGRLRQLPGVADVSPDGDVGVGPPGAPVS